MIFCELPRQFCNLVHKLLSIASAAVQEQICYQARPAGLMAGTNTCPIIAVEVFIEKDQVAPMGVALEFLHASVDRSTSRLVTQENGGQASGKFCRDLFQVQQVAGTGGKLHFERIPIKVMKRLKRLDKQVIERQPDRAAPV